MTPERLEQLKQHIKNPSSASLNREWMLELVEAVEQLTPLAQLGAVHLPLPINEAAESRIEVLLTESRGHAPSMVDSLGNEHFSPPPVVVDDRPKKKGKK